MERTHGKLGTGLANRLGSDDTYSLTDNYRPVCGKVTTIALTAYTMLCLTGKHSLQEDLFNTSFLNLSSSNLVNFLICIGDNFTGKWMQDILYRAAPYNAVCKVLNDFITILECSTPDTIDGVTVILIDHNVLADINQTTGEVPCLSSLQCGIGKALTSTIGGDEELDNRQPFLEVRFNGEFDNITTWLCHQTTHTTELPDLGL